MGNGRYSPFVLVQLHRLVVATSVALDWIKQLKSLLSVQQDLLINTDMQFFNSLPY
jgi:hypothetical protein